MIDLHIHTTASDGEYTPAEVVEMAIMAGAEGLAITDHDTIDGLSEALKWGAKRQVMVIPGIEINAQHEAELHILGYGLDFTHPALLKTCQWLREGREVRGERILLYLAQEGMPLAMEEVRRYAKGHQLGRPHFARAMVDKGYVATTEEAFDHYLTGEAFQAIEREKMKPEQAIQLIREAGGLAVLAHPASLKLDEAALEAYVEQLKGWGLQGMECYYSKNSPSWTESSLAIARRQQLWITGGSDFHDGKTRRNVQIGTGCAHDWDNPKHSVIEQIKAATYWGRHL